MSAFVEAWTGLRLLNPGLLWLVVLVPLVLWWRTRRKRPSLNFAAAPLAFGSSNPLPKSLRQHLLALPVLLQGLAIVVLGIALARPVQRFELPREVAGIDILLCLDVSSSMNAKDLDPQATRLDVVKAAATSFVQGREHDRIGLVRFARFPDLLCPLTLDHGALERFLRELESVEYDGPEDRTGIGTATARAAQVLQRSPGKSKVVILLTDGEENVASQRKPDEIGPDRAAALCERLGIRVYCIAAGIGKRDAQGAWRPLDTTQLQKLAARSGGRFYEAKDAAAIRSVYATIDELETIEFEDPRYEFRDHFVPFLLFGLFVWLAAWALRRGYLELLP